MIITKTSEDRKITLALEGWLDTEAAPLLGEEIEKIEDAAEIILDFDKVEYISSSGLRQVVAAHKKAKEMEAELRMINAHVEVMSVFSLTGLDKKLSIEPAEA